MQMQTVERGVRGGEGLKGGGRGGETKRQRSVGVGGRFTRRWESRRGRQAGS